jgi:ABC-type phosphate transport system substrate-binding protein
MASQRLPRRLRLLLSPLLLTWPLLVKADIAVIVHPDSPLQTLSAKALSDLYLGRAHSLNAGDRTILATVYEQPSDSLLRETFFRSLNGMSISQVNAYWARLRFSGEVLPPLSLADSRQVLEKVKHNRNAIGYVDANLATDAVKVVLRLKE